MKILNYKGKDWPFVFKMSGYKYLVDAWGEDDLKKIHVKMAKCLTGDIPIIDIETMIYATLEHLKHGDNPTIKSSNEIEDFIENGPIKSIVEWLPYLQDALWKALPLDIQKTRDKSKN